MPIFEEDALVSRERVRWRTIGIVAVVLALLGSGFFFRYELPHLQVPAEAVFAVAGFAVTNTMLATWLAMLVIVGFFWAATRRPRSAPGPLQNAAEMVVEALLGLCVSVAGERNGRRFFPLVATIFIYVLVANWMGLLPGYGTIGLYEHGDHGIQFVPLLRGATSDLNTTVALAVTSVVAIQVFGIRTLGAGTYLSRFFDLKGGPIGLFVGVLELIGDVAKIISFSFRLFGNIFAGEVLLTVVAFLLPFVAAIPFLGLELFVGLMQAFVFAMLTLVFLTIATAGHGDVHDEAARHGR